MLLKVFANVCQTSILRERSTLTGPKSTNNYKYYINYITTTTNYRRQRRVRQTEREREREKETVRERVRDRKEDRERAQERQEREENVKDK